LSTASVPARAVCCIILAALLLMILEGQILYRAAQKDALERFEGWKTRFVDDYLAMEEARAAGQPPDPATVRREKAITRLAQVIEGLKLYNYGMNDYLTLGQCIRNRELNPAYADDWAEIIEQPSQWPGFSTGNEVTQATWKVAEAVYDEVNAQEHPPCSNRLTTAQFNRDMIILTDGIEDYTETWWWGKVTS
jgi:hypothetical protein